MKKIKEASEAAGRLFAYFSSANGKDTLRHRNFILDLIESPDSLKEVDKEEFLTYYKWTMDRNYLIRLGDLKLGQYKGWIHKLDCLSKETQIELAKGLLALGEVNGKMGGSQTDILEYMILYLRLDKVL